MESPLFEAAYSAVLLCRQICHRYDTKVLNLTAKPYDSVKHASEIRIKLCN